ncbi:MAG: site-2 protease family protein [Firmicutes bacterium]|nr:site-2 protease family protein [Bacillota bacterium]
MATSVAGIAANFALALLAALLFHLLLSTGNFLLLTIFIYTAYINLLLAIFNLIPIPPLDGSRILAVLLPPKAAAAYQSVEQYGMILLLIILVSGLFGAILIPVLTLIMHILQLPF